MALLGFAIVDLPRLFGEFAAHIFRVFLDEFAQTGKILLHLRRGLLLGRRLRFGDLPALGFGNWGFDRRRHDGLADLGIATQWTGELARLLLAVVGRAVLEPGLELVAVVTNQLICNHAGSFKPYKSILPQMVVERFVSKWPRDHVPAGLNGRS